LRKLSNLKIFFTQESIEKFDDLRLIEDIADKQIGANTLFALETCILKALAKEQKKEIWQLINPSSKKMPLLVGNCIGGGKHSNQEKTNISRVSHYP